MRIKPHCSICYRELKPTDNVILTDIYFIIHKRCSKKNFWGEADRGKFYKVVARHFQYFQRFVHDFNEMGYYKMKN